MILLCRKDIPAQTKGYSFTAVLSAFPHAFCGLHWEAFAIIMKEAALCRLRHIPDEDSWELSRRMQRAQTRSHRWTWKSYPSLTILNSDRRAMVNMAFHDREAGMQKLNEEIKTGQLRQVYLLYGEEDYLRKQYRDKLKHALLGDGDAMNCHYFEGKDINVGEVIDLAQTMPFFSDRRVIVIENSGLCKHGGEQLAEYLKEPAETAFFVLTEKEIDKRSKLFKAITAKGRAVEMSAQDEKLLKRWVLGILKREGKNISERNLELFLEKTGTSMENISRELEKLICYCMGRDVIAGEDIEAICTRQIQNQIFEMMNAIAEKKQRRAMELYYDLLTLKEPPMRILFLLARQFNLLFQVKELKKKGYPVKAIGEAVGLPGFIAGKYATQAARFSMQDLKKAVNDCIETEEAVKTGKMNDRMSVELLLIRYSA